MGAGVARRASCRRIYMGIRGTCRCLPCRHGRSVIARLEVEAGRCRSFCTCHATAGRPHWRPNSLRISGLLALTSPCISAGAALSGLRHSPHRQFTCETAGFPSLRSRPRWSQWAPFAQFPPVKPSQRPHFPPAKPGQAPPRGSPVPFLPLPDVSSRFGAPRPYATCRSGAHGPQASEYKYLAVSSSVPSLLHPHSSHSPFPTHPLPILHQLYLPFPQYSITFGTHCYYSRQLPATRTPSHHG